MTQLNTVSNKINTISIVQNIEKNEILQLRKEIADIKKEMDREFSITNKELREGLGLDDLKIYLIKCAEQLFPP